MSRLDVEIAQADWRELGIVWHLRRVGGSVHAFYTLGDLQARIAAGSARPEDSISYNRSSWTRLSEIDDLVAWFEEHWGMAEREEIDGVPPALAAVDPDDAETALFVFRVPDDDEGG